MGEAAFRLIFTDEARRDLEDLDEYWDARGEPWRAEKYHHDLVHRAEVELSDSSAARRGRPLNSRKWIGARQILAFGVYHIIYRIDEAAGVVEVLRFWHAHRDEPGRDA